MDDERQKKIEAGKLKLAKFKKRKNKGVPVKNATNTEQPICTESHEINNMQQENTDSLKSSSIESLSIEKEVITSNHTEMETNLIRESSFQFSEGSDDALQLESVHSQFESLYQKKFEEYQSTNRRQASYIVQLSGSLEAANKAANSAKSSEVDLKQQISTLQQQMREATDMIESKKLESRENFVNASGDGMHILPNKATNTSAASPQVKTAEVSQQTQTSEQSLDDLLTKYSRTPQFSSVLSNFLQRNATEPELKRIIKVLDPTQSIVSLESIDDALLKFSKFPEFKQKLSIFLKNNSTEDELRNMSKLLCNDAVLENASVDMSFFLRKMETLGVVAKMIESLVNTSSRTLDANSDFSCSKFQSFFLRRLNSTEEPDVLENEGDINYAEVTEPNQDRELGKNSCEFPSVEKLRSGVAAKDFNLVTEFLQEEMSKLSSTVPCFDAMSRGDMMADSLETELPAASFTMEGCEEYQRFISQKAELESRLGNLKKMEMKLQHDPSKSIHNISLDSETLTNSEDNILLEEPPLSCVSLLSLTDSEYKTEFAITDSELNSRKVSLDMSRPAQDRDFCMKCERYYDILREKYDEHLCVFKDTLENSLSVEKIKNLNSEIEKLRLEKEKMAEENSQQVELICQEHEMKVRCLKDEFEKDNLEKGLSVGKIKNLNSEIEKLRLEKEKMAEVNGQQVELICKEHEMKVKCLKEGFEKDFEEFKKGVENEMMSKVRSLEEEISRLSEKVEGVSNERDSLMRDLEVLKSSNAAGMKEDQSRIEAHLEVIRDFKDQLAEAEKYVCEVNKENEHLLQELEAVKLSNAKIVEEEKLNVETKYIETLEFLKNIHEIEIGDLKNSFKTQLEELELSLNNSHSEAINLLRKEFEEKELSLKNEHSEFSNVKKLLEEKELNLNDLQSKVTSLEKNLTEKELSISDQNFKVTNLLKELEEKENSLKEQHSKSLNLEKQLEEKELCLKDQHSKAISLLEATHLNESATHSKKD